MITGKFSQIFGYKLNMKTIFFSNILLYFWLFTQIMYKNLEIFSYFFLGILAIENI